MIIQKGVVKVVYNSGIPSYQWLKIKRRSLKTLINNLKKLPNFRYAKIYSINKQRQKIKVASCGNSKKGWYEINE